MPRRPPEQTHAYLVGGGIASLTAAVHLYHDAGVPAAQIHIIEAAPVPGGSMSQANSQAEEAWKRGYVILAARKLNFSYRCLYATLAKVPSARHPGQTVLDDVHGVVEETRDRAVHPVAEADKANKAHNEDDDGDDNESTASKPRRSYPARLVAAGADGPQIVDVQSMGLRSDERMGLLGLILEREERIGDGQIQAHFRPDFFESKFWDVWASLYGFQPWHSAVEFRRYLLRFLHEFAHISTLEGIDHAPLNDYECIIQPLEQHLKGLGVDFRYETRVTGVRFAPGARMHVSQLDVESKANKTANATKETLTMGPHDIVLITLGTMTASMRFGTNDSPPQPLPSQEAVLADPGPVWQFWRALADPTRNAHAAAFGRPQAFYGHISKSSWLSFTITLSGSAVSVFERLKAWAGFESDHLPVTAPSPDAQHLLDSNGDSPDSFSNSNGPLITFRDSPWMMSITMPHQPYFTGQPDDVRVLWGYGLYPDQEGLFVHKAMMACTGAEIFAELLAHLHMAPPTLQTTAADGTTTTTGAVTTIPCLMPFIGAPFLARTVGDRPSVRPGDSDNLGLLGQFVEMERDVTFTMEYSARTAQTAVFGLMGLEKKPPGVHRGDRDVQVLGKMLLTIMS